MSYSRNTEWLNQKRIVYIRYPITDVPTETYSWGWYYEDGTNQCYELFRSKANITSVRSLKWHLLVLRYLNQNLTWVDFLELCFFIADKKNNFISIDIPNELLLKFAGEVFNSDFNFAPKNKSRKVIFKVGCGLEAHEKLQIVGGLIGRSKSINEDDIYQCMLEINNDNEKITIAKIAKMLNCTSRTIFRNINEELRNEKDILNSQL
jgi:preprotein translocase subunit YajC